MGRRSIKVVFVGCEVARSTPTFKSYMEIIQDTIKTLKGTTHWYDSKPGSAVNTLLEAQSGKKGI